RRKGTWVLQRQFAADEDQHRSERTAQQPFRNLLAQRAAEPYSGERADKEGHQQFPVHRPGRGMPQTGDQSERYGMSDVGTDDARNGKAWVKEKQDRHTQRASAYR